MAPQFKVTSLLFLMVIGKCGNWESDIHSETNDEPLAKGVLFHEETTIVLAEKFIQVEFFVPFPKFELNIREDVNSTLQVLKRMWKQPTVNCNLSETTNFNTDESEFSVDWLIREIEAEVNSSKEEIEQLHNETAAFLNGQQVATTDRLKRDSGDALSSIGLFGSGLVIGSQGDCGLLGIFGTCQENAKINAENILRIADYSEQIADYVQKLKSQTNEKLYLVSDELKDIRKIQQDMAKLQNKNWQVVMKQFKIFETNMHGLVFCQQQLYARQQINFNYDTLSSLLSLVYANVKAYRSALYSYRMNMMNSISPLLKKYLPMSLVSRNSLHSILKEVTDELSTNGSRLSLAIPRTDILSYYDAQLLREVISLEDGLLMTLSIPLASSQTSMKVYKAITLPMPQEEEGTAIQWKTEAKYLAVAEGKLETAHLSQDQLDKCIGSVRYKICHEAVATDLTQTSCLSALFFRHSTVFDVMRVCETEKVYLPAMEKAENLGYGIWLITSATGDFHLTESDMGSTNPSEGERFNGCQICIITLACGREMRGKNIRIRSDLSSCQDLAAIKLQVKLPDPLQGLMRELPDIDSLPYFTSKTDAGLQLLRSVRAELQMIPKVPDSERIQEIAKPLAIEMTMLKPTLLDQLSTFLPFKISLTISIISFVMSLILHALFMWCYHKFHLGDRVFKRRMKLAKGKRRSDFDRLLLVNRTTSRKQARRSTEKMHGKNELILLPQQYWRN